MIYKLFAIVFIFVWFCLVMMFFSLGVGLWMIEVATQSIKSMQQLMARRVSVAAK